jgi:hypothetical protein
MYEVELTWQRILSVWWLVTWRATVGSIVLGAVAGGCAGAAVTRLGHAGDARLAGAWAGRVVAIPWLFVVLKMAFQKRYRGFRIAFVQN